MVYGLCFPLLPSAAEAEGAVILLAAALVKHNP